MKHHTKFHRSQQFQQFKQSFLQIRGLPFSDILSTQLLARICECIEDGRERIFTPLVVLTDVPGLNLVFSNVYNEIAGFWLYRLQLMAIKNSQLYFDQ